MSDTRVTIGTFIDGVSANLAKGRVESEGITAFLLDEGSVNMMPLLTNAIGGIRLQVLARDEESARAILAQGEEPSLPREGEEAPLNPREQKAERAFRGAVLGIALLPLQVYILWVLLDVLLSTEPLRPEKRRRALLAAMINIPLVIAFFFVWRRLSQY